MMNKRSNQTKVGQLWRSIWIIEYFLWFGCLFLLMSTLLTGCASTHTDQKQTVTCSGSSVLYTDLLKSDGDRIYELPDGSICPDEEGD